MNRHEGDDLDRDLREEIESHIRMRAEHDRISAAQARRRFGNATQIQEEMRTMHIPAYLDDLAQDLRYALRRAVRMPGFTFAVVAAIAIGIGASTAVFSVVDRILFRPLPYAHEEQLVWLGMTAPIAGDEEFLLAGDYFDWKEHQTVFSHFAASQGVEDCDVTEENPSRLRCLNASHDFLETFGLAPALGRNLLKTDTGDVLISHDLWRNRYGARDSALNQTIQLNGKPWRIIGVLPRDFEIPSLAKVDIMRPLDVDEASERSRKGRMTFLQAWARLKPGVSLEQAGAAMQPVFQQSLQYVPPSFVKEVRLKMTALRQRQSGNSRPLSLALLAAVLSLLLIACANVANLLLARVSASERESAIRAAIGASRSRLIRQTLVETLLLTGAGGLAGILLASLLLRVSIAFAPLGIPRLEHATLDARILAFALGLTFLCGLLCSLLPALRQPGIEAMSGGARHTRATGWLRPALVMMQVAFASALLYSASVLGESLWRMQQVPLGIATSNRMVALIQLRDSHYEQPAARDAFWNSLTERVSKLPGIERFALSDSLPPAGRTAVGIYSRMRVDGRPEDLRGGTGGMVVWRSVSPAYFATLGVPLRFGRLFNEEDRRTPDERMILSETLARRFFPTPETSIGHTIQRGPGAQPATVIGIVADAKNNGFERDDPEFYTPLPGQNLRPVLTLTVQVAPGASDTLTRQLLRSELTALDPHIPVTIEALEDRTAKLTAGAKFNTTVLALFSLAGLLLGATGIFSVVSFLVSQRTREIGVRVALGATSQNIRKMILSYAVRWTAAGCVAACALIAYTAPHLQKLLYRQTSPASPQAAAVVLTVMALIAIGSALVPAMRAARLDPIQTLRED